MRKETSYMAEFEAHVNCLLLGQNVWWEANYHITNLTWRVARIPSPTWLMPPWTHLFYSAKCNKCIKIQEGPRSWWIGRWVLYLCPWHLVPLLVHIFNRARCEGLPTRWTEHTIMRILKSGNPMMPSNYRTIMMSHYLAKLYGSILESELSIWASETASVQLDRQAFETDSQL